MLTPHALAKVFRHAHDQMRGIDGLQPHEAFDELLKFLFYLEGSEVRRKARKLPAAGGNPSPVTARQIRRQFAECVGEATLSGATTWKGQSFRLSDSALLELVRVFRGISIAKLELDLRSAALKEFLSPEVRRGLGIFLTPDQVAEMVVAIISPDLGEIVYDPACGSGTFLIETIRHWRRKDKVSRKLRVTGSDKSARMLLVAEHNLAHDPRIEFRGFTQDALAEFDDSPIVPGTVDHILTNPPFGVTVRLADSVGLAKSGMGSVPSEILFVLTALRLLRPGGTLGIVLPRSVVTNNRLGEIRAELGQLGAVEAMVTLPPETFAPAGTQTTTCVLIIRKYLTAGDQDRQVGVVVASATNVGHDSTGRHRADCDLPQVAADVRQAVATGRTQGSARMISNLSAKDTFNALARLTSAPSSHSATVCLGDVCESIGVGRTPARSAYSESGLFILKVGNLTGHGIDWEARDRNFVPDRVVRAGTRDLFVRTGDLLLTSSAHSPRYIAKKVDIVPSLDLVGGQATFVGELMRVRAKPGVNPYHILAYLRSEEAMRAIQSRVRGQTAHLMPDDLADLPVPEVVFTGHPTMVLLSEALEAETRLAFQLSSLARKQHNLLAELLTEAQTDVSVRQLVTAPAPLGDSQTALGF
jgi:type I restriction enzyme M protein